mgnify:CR=1
MTQLTLPIRNVFVSQSSFDSTDPYDIVYSNVFFVDALFGAYFKKDEVCQDALRSYYLDYYLA